MIMAVYLLKRSQMLRTRAENGRFCAFKNGMFKFFLRKAKIDFLV
jgi:hypothetical protein